MSSNLDGVDVISSVEIGRYLRQAREVCGENQICDIHVHATEVIRDRIEYMPSVLGLRESISASEYRKPTIANIRLASAGPQQSSPRHLRISELAFSRAYQYTGARVLGDQLDLAGVDRAALLPVAASSRSLSKQMQIIRECCDDDERFRIGYSISNDVPDEEIFTNLKAAVENFQVRILKVHPNLAGIDLGSNEGRARMETILRACDKLSLPLILHGGCSPIMGESRAASFSQIRNLRGIDWSLTHAAVVIAHFGIYGCDGRRLSELSDATVTLLEMLREHANLFVDTSGVSFDAIKSMFKVIDLDRVVFGSDALYVPIYRQLVLVMHALNVLGENPTVFRTIASSNASIILGE